MREKISALAAGWRRDRLWGTLAALWIASVFASSPGVALFPVTFPGVGTLFLFRLLLPVTALLYILYALRERIHIWRDAPALERWCYLLAAIMLIYSLASLPRALDVVFTLRRLFNLCFDLGLFFLTLRMWRYERLRRPMLLAFAGGLILVLLLGLWQMATPGVYNEVTNHFHVFFFFDLVFQSMDVTQGNPNDYAAAFAFAAAVFLLWWAARWKKTGKDVHYLSVFSLILVYFLSVANGARLVKLCFWILFWGFTAFLLLADRRRLWISLTVLALVCGIWFGNQYRYIMPSVQSYLSQLDEYRHQPGNEAAPPPKLQIDTAPTETLDEEFYTIDEKTGEKTLRDEGSGGIRARLLIHAFRCFRESRGLGVGLGNTESLAPRRNIIPGWANASQNNIHCFLARAASDYGIFFLLPLCAAALLLLKRVVELLAEAVRTRDFSALGLPIYNLSALVIFPIASTASSDAQDIAPMWFFLAAAVIFAEYYDPRSAA